MVKKIIRMPRTDINKILKHGAQTKVPEIDYSTADKQSELKDLKKKSDVALNNKNYNPAKSKIRIPRYSPVHS